MGVTHEVIFEPDLKISDYKYLSELGTRQKLRKELGVKNDDLLLISVGELSERKNQIVVLKALDVIKYTNPELFTKIKYIIVGQGILESRYKEYITSRRLETNVLLLGFRSDIPELLKSSDLFVFPSIQEGLPVALMEAMSSGIDVVCSNIRGNTDLVKEGLFEAEDVEELIRLIVERTKGKSHKTHDYRHMMTNFSSGRILRELRYIYSIY